MPDAHVVTVVLGLLSEREYRPSELILALRGRGFSAADAKEAMSYLVHGQRVELTPDRMLRAAEFAHA
jgi:hypothetical protein